MKQKNIDRLARIESAKKDPGFVMVEILNNAPGCRCNGRIYESFADIPERPRFWLVVPEQYETVEEWEAAMHDGITDKNPCWGEWAAMCHE